MPWRSSRSGRCFPTLILLTYNQLAFGSPWDMGYFHHATKQFADVHNADNPLGLRFPDQFWQQAPGPALGPLSRAHVLRSDLVADGSRLGRLDRPPALGPGGRDVLRGRRGRAREPVLPRMDRRLVDRSAAARSLDTVRDAARGRPPGGRFTRGNGGHDDCPRTRRWLVEP